MCAGRRRFLIVVGVHANDVCLEALLWRLPTLRVPRVASARGRTAAAMRLTLALMIDGTSIVGRVDRSAKMQRKSRIRRRGKTISISWLRRPSVDGTLHRHGGASARHGIRAEGHSTDTTGDWVAYSHGVHATDKR
jgi:hypothetical protein